MSSTQPLSHEFFANRWMLVIEQIAVNCSFLNRWVAGSVEPMSSPHLYRMSSLRTDGYLVQLVARVGAMLEQLKSIDEFH